MPIGFVPMQLFIYTYIFLFALALSLVLVPPVRLFAARKRVVDRPNERKHHGGQRPLLGGLAIYAACYGTLGFHLILYWVIKNLDWANKFWPRLAEQSDYLPGALPKLVAIFLGSSIVLLLGIVDDRKGAEFSYRVKFAVQFLAAGVLVVLGVRVSFMPAEWLNAAVTLVWVVGMTNAFNLLDNMDGLSAGIAMIACAIFGVVTAMQDQFFSALIFFVLMGAIGGFLRHNFHPAKLFMGDTGSLFLGFILAALSITNSYVVPDSASLLPAFIPLLIFSIPIFDTISVMLIRVKERRPLFKGDRRHFSHRLVDLGMSQRDAVVFIYLVALSIGLAASLLPYLPLWAQLLVLFQTVLIYLMISILIHVAKTGRPVDMPVRQSANPPQERL